MSDAHVIMPPNIRPTVCFSQRLSVTAFRNNIGMPKPPGMPGRGSTLGKRVRFWREHRKNQGKQGYTQVAFAKRVGYSPGGLSDLENDRSFESERSHVMAADLGLNAHYLDTGEGEPEIGFTQEPPGRLVEGLIPDGILERLSGFDPIERQLAGYKFSEALDEIEKARKRQRKTSRDLRNLKTAP